MHGRSLKLDSGIAVLSARVAGAFADPEMRQAFGGPIKDGEAAEILCYLAAAYGPTR